MGYEIPYSVHVKSPIFLEHYLSFGWLKRVEMFCGGFGILIKNPQKLLGEKLTPIHIKFKCQFSVGLFFENNKKHLKMVRIKNKMFIKI